MSRVGVRELIALGRVVASGRLQRYHGGGSGFTSRFEAGLARKLGAKHILTVNSGTGALITALIGAGIGRGDGVLVPAYTWVSTAIAPMAVRAVPVIVDVDESLNIDPEDIKRKIAPHTKAIMPCSHGCEMIQETTMDYRFKDSTEAGKGGGLVADRSKGPTTPRSKAWVLSISRGRLPLPCSHRSLKMTKAFACIILSCGMVASAYAEPQSQSGVKAVSCDTFLSSLGVNTHVDQGYSPDSYVLPLQYLGIRNIRDSERNLSGHLMLHEKTGILVDLLGADVRGLTIAAKTLAQAGALLSIEGPNEPNNFPITYNGQQGGGMAKRWLPGLLLGWFRGWPSWLPVAQLQKDLYSAVKNDPELSRYPVFHVSEGGAETDNVGLQFLKVPAGAETLLPDGTQFADYANAHNYVSGIRIGYVDNQAWQAADPTLDSDWDGLYGEYGRTWRRHFTGYSKAELQSLPRVTSETGWDAGSPEAERTQGIALVNTYLAQFKRDWRYTFIYELGEGEGGEDNQGLFHKDWTPKLAATYIHSLTSILADSISVASPGRLDYSLANVPSTVHDLLLQKSGGVFELVVWGEQVKGTNNITVNLGRAYAKVRLYDTTMGTAPIQILADVTSVPLTVSDHALILEIQ